MTERVVPVRSPETAEAVKLTENIFRAVNIALVNELKQVFGAMGIDVWEVIEAARTKPFGYMPFQPGPGLGGHCIPVDPSTSPGRRGRMACRPVSSNSPARSTRRCRCWCWRRWAGRSTPPRAAASAAAASWCWASATSRTLRMCGKARRCD
ncbi:hypothetical protein ACFQU2_34985 [Siccirubricoccus deserti]